MKENGKLNIDLKAWGRQFGKYKYVVLMIGIGVLLLLIPTSSTKESDSKVASNVEEDFSVEALEEQLEHILTRIEGAGQVSVMLTVERGMKRIFAQDGHVEQKNESLRKESETVVISSGSGTQETVLVQQIYPKFQGALIVAEGGGDPSVRLNLTEAVAALTGLGADKISVCKGK